MMKKFVQHSVLVIVDVQPKDLGLPTEAYIEVEEVHDVTDFLYDASLS